MALLDTLSDAFTEGGFSLTGTVGTLESSVGDIDPEGPGIDEGGLGRIGDLLAEADFGSIGAAVEATVAQAGGVSAGLPDPQALIQPLEGSVRMLERLGGGDALAVIGAFDGAAAAGGAEVGLGGLAARLSAVTEARASAPVAEAVSLASGLIPGLDLDTPVALLGQNAPAAAGLVRLVGALMTVEALTRELAETTEVVGGMLGADAAVAAAKRLESWRGVDLTALVEGIDPDDDAAVRFVLGPIANFADSVREGAEELVRGMAFGEAALVHADLARVSGRLDAASGALDESAVVPVRALAVEVRTRIEPLLAIDLGTPAASLEAFWDEATGFVDELAAAVDGIDPNTLAAPVTAIVGDALAVVQRVREVAEEITVTIRSALQTVRQAIAAIDVRPVTEAVSSVLAPLVEALDALEALIGDAGDAVRDTALGVTSALTSLRTTLGTAATTITGAYERVAGLVDALELEQLQQTLESELANVGAALERAQLRPYFDAAADAMETAANVVAAVPFELLPDDARSELDDAIAPIKAIDFEGDVRDVLVAQLRLILDALETDVLDEIDAAYQAVVTFLEEINPRAPLEQLELEAFDPMLERVRAVDPTEVLAPVTAVLEELRAAVEGIDLRGEVLGPLDEAFDVVAGPLAELDPGALLAPLEERVTAAREAVIDLIALDTWSGRIDGAEAFVVRLLERLDFATLVDLLDAAFDEVRPHPGTPVEGPSVIGTLVSGLLEGTGLTARADAFATVARWLGGADPAPEIRQRLEAAAAALEGTLAVVRAVEPEPLVAAVQPVYRDLVAAVSAHPEDSLLRRQVDPMLARAAPLELLGTAVDNRVRYLAALEEASTLLRREAGSGRSELTAVAAGLREAMRPLTAVPDGVRALFTRSGVDVDGKSLGTIAAETLEILRPSRALAPVTAAIAALEAKVVELLHEGVFVPAHQVVDELQALLAAIDISFVRTELEAVHAEVVAEVEQFRPSTLLGELVTSAEETLAVVAAFDPLGAVTAVIEEMKAAIEDVVNNFRPTVLFAPILKTYDEIVAAASGLDVRNLLAPVLEALAEIEVQLEEGLTTTAAALTQLQEALP